MRPLNDQEWKELQEFVKKIDEEPSAIGVDFYVASFNITKDGIKYINGRRLLKRTKREKPYKAKISIRSELMADLLNLKSMFLNRNKTERVESVREKFKRARKVKKKKEKEFKKKLKKL